MASKEIRQRELTRIYRRDGSVAPSVVVKEATPKRAPLHDEFEWDDKVAAHQHRLDTARRIIRVVKIAPAKNQPPQRLIHVPVEVVEGPTANQRSSREGCYKPAEVVASDPNELERALKEALSQLRALERLVADIRRAAGEEPPLLVQLTDALHVARDTVSLMLRTAA
jgi:hypothetical protein